MAWENLKAILGNEVVDEILTEAANHTETQNINIDLVLVVALRKVKEEVTQLKIDLLKYRAEILENTLAGKNLFSPEAEATIKSYTGKSST